MENEMKTKVMTVGTAFCIALFLFSGFILCREYFDQKQSAKTFEEAAELAREEPGLPVLELESGSEPVQGEMTAFDKYVSVHTQSSNLVGWVSIPGARIDYPVMQIKDNPDFYLRHAFDKSYSSYSFPYVQENYNIDTPDNLVLYGHHMNNDSMFSNPCKYESEDFYQEYKVTYLDTLESSGEYEVVAASKTVVYPQEELKHYHSVRVENAKQSDGHTAECKELTFHDTNVTAECGDRLITLSTCEYSRTNRRVVVLAKLLEE